VAFSPVARSAKPAWADPGPLVSAGLLLAAVLVAYLPALRGGFLWDDDAHVTKAALRSLHGLWRIWFEAGATQQYYPVLHTAFWIEHRLWGDSVLGYHLANVALHAAAAWLLVLILRGLSFPAPLLAGMLFALHPVCVESVAWISEEKNTLSAVFYLWSALLYLRFDESRAGSRYWWALVLFALALLSKSVTATLPAALLVVLWWRRGRLDWRRDIMPLVPWFAVGVGSGLFSAWYESKLIGAEGADFSLSALQRLLLAGRAIAFYAGKLVWPRDLIFVYPRWELNTGEIGLYLCLAGVVALLAALAVVARKSRGPLAGFLFFCGTLFPALGFVNVYPFVFSFVADHFQYLASIGVLVPIAWALDRFAPPNAAGRACLLLAVAAALGFLSWRQCHAYAEADTLNRTTLERNPSAWLAHYNLAVSLGSRPGHLPEAISEYEATIRLKPDHWAAHNNLGSAFLASPGRISDAIAEYEEALRINPGFAEAHNNLAVALGRDPGRRPDAIAHLRTAIRLRPDYDGALNNLGAILMREPGKLDEAIGDFKAAIRLSPGNPEYHYDLANALAAAPGRQAEAIAEYRESIRLRPSSAEAHGNLGEVLARVDGRLSEAIAELETAAQLAPGRAEAHVNLANALARDPARIESAVAEYTEAERIDPGNAQVHVALGVTLLRVPGRRTDALSQFEAAVRLRPDYALAHYCLGQVLLRMPGRRDEAVGHLERALAIDPGFGPARKALEQLESGR
jgi:tetratricopeptide (TPR) repeat protein